MADYNVVSPKVAQYLKLYADKNAEEQMAAETQKQEEEPKKQEAYYAKSEPLE